MRTVNPAEESQARFRETLNVGDFLEPIIFRGSIESASLAVSPSPTPAPPHKQKSKRSAGRTTTLPKLPVEIPQPDPRPPSFLERLFGMDAPATQTQTPPQT